MGPRCRSVCAAASATEGRLTLALAEPATTVCGLTMASAEHEPDQRPPRQIHKRRSLEVKFGRFVADL
jgi:hypothetical protein